MCKHKRYVPCNLLRVLPFFFVLLLFAASCISSINQENVDRIKDTGAPTITIQSPTDGSYYTELITVEGTVADDSGESGGVGEIKSLSDKIIGPLKQPA